MLAVVKPPLAEDGEILDAAVQQRCAKSVEEGTFQSNPNGREFTYCSGSLSDLTREMSKVVLIDPEMRDLADSSCSRFGADFLMNRRGFLKHATFDYENHKCVNFEVRDTVEGAIEKFNADRLQEKKDS